MLSLTPSFLGERGGVRWPDPQGKLFVFPYVLAISFVEAVPCSFSSLACGSV